MGTRHIYALDPRGVAALQGYLDHFWARSLEAFKAAAESDAVRKSPPPRQSKQAQPNRRK